MATRQLGCVYLIHFRTRYKHAGHYIGWTSDLESRLLEHKGGTGARLMEVIKEAGIDWEVARVWYDVDRKFERKLKRQGGASRTCPICKAAKLEENSCRN